MLLNRVRPLFRVANNSNVAQIKRAYQIDTSYHRFPCFNDLPVPQGSWRTNYEATQSKYNAALAASVVAFTATVAYLKTSEVLFINWAPPDTYE